MKRWAFFFSFVASLTPPDSDEDLSCGIDYDDDSAVGPADVDITKKIGQRPLYSQNHPHQTQVKEIHVAKQNQYQEVNISDLRPKSQVNFCRMYRMLFFVYFTYYFLFYNIEIIGRK